MEASGFMFFVLLWDRLQTGFKNDDIWKSSISAFVFRGVDVSHTPYAKKIDSMHDMEEADRKLQVQFEVYSSIPCQVKDAERKV